MAFKKKEKSEAIDMARLRLTGMKQIDTAKARVIDYGDLESPCTSVTLQADIDSTQALIDNYNLLLTQADDLANLIAIAEGKLNDVCIRVLSGGRSKFGPDSSEIEQLGGTRRSERARPVKRLPKAA